MKEMHSKAKWVFVLMYVLKKKTTYWIVASNEFNWQDALLVMWAKWMLLPKSSCLGKEKRVCVLGDWFPPQLQVGQHCISVTWPNWAMITTISSGGPRRGWCLPRPRSVCGKSAQLFGFPLFIQEHTQTHSNTQLTVYSLPLTTPWILVRTGLLGYFDFNCQFQYCGISADSEIVQMKNSFTACFVMSERNCVAKPALRWLLKSVARVLKWQEPRLSWKFSIKKEEQNTYERHLWWVQLWKEKKKYVIIWSRYQIIISKSCKCVWTADARYRWASNKWLQKNTFYCSWKL